MSTFQSNAVKSGIMPDHGVPAGAVLSRVAQYVVPTGGHAADDKIEMVPMPAGAIVLDVLLEWAALASGATLTVNAESDADGFFSAVVATNAGRISLFGGVANGAEIDEGPNAEGLGYIFTADDTIDVTLGTAGAAAADVLTMAVLYTMSGSIKDEASFINHA